MNRAIIFKTAREMLGTWIIVLVGVFGLELLLVVVIGDFAEELEYLWQNIPILQRFAQMLLGADLGGELTATSMITIGYAHPILFAMSWGFALAIASRVITGEIERGTVDLLLSLPVSRTVVYSSVSVVWLAAGIPIFIAVAVGTFTGELLSPMWEPIRFHPLIICACNLYALYVCVGCVTMGVAAFSVRRGVVIGIVLAWLLSSFLLNFFAQVWDVAGKINWVSIMQYYQPLPVVRTGDWPIRNLAVLLGLAAAFWLAGLWRFRQRDIPAA